MEVIHKVIYYYYSNVNNKKIKEASIFLNVIMIEKQILPLILH